MSVCGGGLFNVSSSLFHRRKKNKKKNMCLNRTLCHVDSNSARPEDSCVEWPWPPTSTVPIPGPTRRPPSPSRACPPTTLTRSTPAAPGQMHRVILPGVPARPAAPTRAPARTTSLAGPHPLQSRRPSRSPPLPPSPAPSPEHARSRWTLQSRYPPHPRPQQTPLPHSNSSPLCRNHSRSRLTHPHPLALRPPLDPQHRPLRVMAAGIKTHSLTFNRSSTR